MTATAPALATRRDDQVRDFSQRTGGHPTGTNDYLAPPVATTLLDRSEVSARGAPKSRVAQSSQAKNHPVDPWVDQPDREITFQSDAKLEDAQR